MEGAKSSTISENLEPIQTHVMEKRIQGYRPHMNWPKSCSKKEWEMVNADLEGLQGTAEKKLERMSDLIYEYGVERFGPRDPRKNKTTTSLKSRRQQEIKCLVKERIDLRKQWRKGSIEEKEGIIYCEQTKKECLTRLRREENLRI